MCATVSAILTACFVTTESVVPNYLRTILFHPSGAWLLGVYWTLHIEAMFYGLIFLLLLIDAFGYIEAVAIALGNLFGTAFFD